MANKILMPALSPTMTEGTLTKWLVAVGDNVKAGDAIAEIETDKATMEVEAVDEGIVTKLLIDEGSSSVPVNSTIAILDGSKEDNDTVMTKTSDDNTINQNIEIESISEISPILRKVHTQWKKHS